MESTKPSQVVELPKEVHSPPHAVYLEHFAEFLHQSHFTRDFASVYTDLAPLVSTSPPLWHVAVAIGSLRASRKCSVRSQRRRQSAHYIAWKSYEDSIQGLRSKISEGLSVYEEGTLWCTFLLGLFELMTKTSGDGWAKHMLFGTAKMLQPMRNTIRSSSLRQKLFDAFRVLEINRAILYGEPTMLSQGRWPVSGDSVPFKSNDGWDSMGTVLTLMMNTSSFSQTLFGLIENRTGHLEYVDLTLEALANEGIEIQNQLEKWQDKIASLSDVSDPVSRLAMANSHGLLLFHCRNFTFHSLWRQIPGPSLNLHKIEEHVDAILEHTDEVLRSSGIPGVLLLFPLRMAGANVFEDSKKHKIVKLLDRIYQGGFIVAEVIRTDLEDLWRDQRLQSDPAY